MCPRQFRMFFGLDPPGTRGAEEGVRPELRRRSVAPPPLVPEPIEIFGLQSFQ